MRTLSIRQPWAWLITRPDLVDSAARAEALSAGLLNDIENRDWSTDYRGRFLIHASQRMVQRDYWQTYEDLKERLGIELPHFLELDLGGIVGAATLVDVVSEHPSPWFIGPFGWVLRDARPLPFVDFKGQLNWFDVPRSLIPRLTPFTERSPA